MMERELKIELDELLAERATLDRRITRVRYELMAECTHPQHAVEQRFFPGSRPGTREARELTDCAICGARLSDRLVGRG